LDFTYDLNKRRGVMSVGKIYKEDSHLSHSTMGTKEIQKRGNNLPREDFMMVGGTCGSVPSRNTDTVTIINTSATSGVEKKGALEQ
jgi:hypothetical protein